MKKETLVVRSDSLATVAVMENCFFGDKPFISLQNSWVSEEDWEFCVFFLIVKFLEISMSLLAFVLDLGGASCCQEALRVFFFFLIGGKLLYSVVLVSAVQYKWVLITYGATGKEPACQCRRHNMQFGPLPPL